MTFGANPDPAAVRSIRRGGEAARSAGEELKARLEWTDEALMAGVSTQDEHAFAVLYGRYAELVYSTSMRILGDSQLAEESTQDVFVRLWRRPEAFQPQRGKFLSWILSVSRHRAVDELRLRGRRMRREVASIGFADEPCHHYIEPQTDPVDDPLVSAQLTEEREAVRAALRAIPAEQRRALELAYFAGLTQQEIALVLCEPLGTVKTRMRLGMQKLRRSLEGRLE
jgi:RNA polymerase sigma-70 factor (ECF subfamily)